MLGETVEDFQPTWFEKLGAAVVKMGPMPKHIAVILDGNRRYAKKNDLGNVTAGHLSGRKKVDEVTDMLLWLGVEELTVYVFSMENFKRSMEEITGILKLMKERSSVTKEWIETANRKGICYEFIGNLSLNPSTKLQKSIEKNMLITKDNKMIKVNVAFINTGRNEICRGANDLLEGVHEGKIEIHDVTEDTLPDCFNLHSSSNNVVDILIRTSGECRLSDFMLWQSDQAHLDFVEITWPEYTFWELLKAIFRYQIHVKRNTVEMGKLDRFTDTVTDKNVKRFIDERRAQKWNKMNISSF